ncbi:diguanylate cyclase DgcN-like [Colias croceus]|uniref:diguanylate cyclase DgcN-like n=1 Tax=Colias crocea TaxID=72248 RepID=UPI001E27C73A|nr:diguanylate cyclase DgcN-like [Colias croceus]
MTQFLFRLEDAVVFHDSASANESLSVLGRQGQFTAAKVVDSEGRELIHWQAEKPFQHDMIGSLVTGWLYPHPIRQPIWHNGKIIGEMRLIGTDATVTLFVWLALGVLTACILLASPVATYTVILTPHCRILLTLSTTSAETDFNSLLDEMEDWQIQLQLKNASLQKTALQDSLTGLANRAVFRTALNRLIEE